MVLESTNFLRVAIAQMCSTNTFSGNVLEVEELAKRASNAGANLLVLPACSGLLNTDGQTVCQQVTMEWNNPFLMACRDLASSYGLWINTGSIPVRDEMEPQYLVHRSHLIDDKGDILAHYDKIHLFEVDFRGQLALQEFERYKAGTRAVVASTRWGGWGMSICSDIRFPKLYQEYAHLGARLLFVPSAFLMALGSAHWQTLVRARAIENGCYVIAPAQCGLHEDGWETWGHSMVVDPWGRVLADMGRDNGLAAIDLDLSQVEAARKALPTLRDARTYELCVSAGSPDLVDNDLEADAEKVSLHAGLVD